MALDATTAQELIRTLAANRDAYLENVNKTTELLLQAVATSVGVPPPQLSTGTSRRNTVVTVDVESVHKNSTLSAEEDSESDTGESYFAQTPLQPEIYDEEGLREHLRSYNWTEEGRKILYGVLENESLLRRSSLFPTELGELPDRSHLTHYSIFDVGPDGASLPVRTGLGQGPNSVAVQIWNRLKQTNANPNTERKAVGRMTIVREPSPLLFAALHYTMRKHFDMDEMFSFLIDHDPVLAHPHRAFAEDDRHARTFIFNLEYFTIIGETCEPPHWQHADNHRDHTSVHIPISRCTAIVALSLEGAPIAKVRNKQRRQQKRFGYVYDPFSPWRVLSIQSYPDWHSSTDTHDYTKNYVNGCEAFLVTLRSEFRDAAKRLTAVYRAITDLVEPPADFIFNLDTRDKLLFEDDAFTYSRRYFWAAQTLGIMSQDIRDMVETYEESFKDSIWDGTDKIIWPGGGAGDEASSRRANWRRRMALIRRDLTFEIDRLKEIERLNERRMQVIRGLNENLYSGTSVHESRRSVEQTAITVEQGRNVKLLTLVTVFFLPLTLVTSIFGMTNMPQNDNFYHFAWTTIAISLPTYLLIGSLATTRGLDWWHQTMTALHLWASHILAAFLRLFGFQLYNPHDKSMVEESPDLRRPRNNRSRSIEAAMLAREALSGLPMLSPQPTKTAQLATDAPEPEHDAIDPLSPVQTEGGGMERSPHRPRSAKIKFRTPSEDFDNLTQSSSSTPRMCRVDNGQKQPAARPTAMLINEEKLRVARLSPIAVGEENKRTKEPRKGSLAEFRDFWEWQKSGRAKTRAQDIIEV